MEKLKVITEQWLIEHGFTKIASYYQLNVPIDFVGVPRTLEANNLKDYWIVNYKVGAVYSSATLKTPEEVLTLYKSLTLKELI